MAGSPRRVYSRSENVVSRAIGGQRLLIPIRAKGADLAKIFALNATAAAAWDRLASPAAAEALAVPLAEEYGEPVETVQADLEELLAALEKRGLVTVTEGGA